MYIVYGPSNKIHQDIPTIEEARKRAQKEVENNPRGPAEIYKLIEVCEIKVLPVEFRVVE